jgi:hypothetical protein
MADAVEHAGASVVQVRGRRWRPAAGVVCSDEHVLAADHTIER